MARDIRVATASARFVLLHYHIFKNGGSTIDFALSRSFGEGFADFHGMHDDATLVAEDIASLVLEDESIVALSSHHTRYPKPRARGVIFFDICFLRHPLTRIRSLYFYGRRLDPGSPLAQLAQTRNEADFVTHLLEHLPHMLTNVQTTYLANGAVFARPSGPRDLDTATAMLAEMSVPGVVELFDESLVAGEFFLRPAFPKIDFAYIAQNVSVSRGYRPSGQDDIFETCRNNWGTDNFDAVLALNTHDLRLHDAARGEVLRRLHSLPSHEARLAGFRTRCLDMIPV